MIDRRVLAEVLTLLEDREIPLLTWGLVDSVLSENEVRSTITQALDGLGRDLDADDVLDELVDAALLLEAPDRPGYRTRVAEAIRLAVRNRQLFARGTGDWWLRGRRLISDYRLDVRPRTYPKRDREVSELHAEIEQAVPHVTAAQQAVATALVPPNEVGSRTLSSFQLRAAADVLAGLHGDRSTGVIVSAGTGSGKTLAFYLPAFVWLTGRTSRPDQGSAPVLALYPRTELLKDQLSEALRSVLSIRQAVPEGQAPSIRLGTFYGATPQDSRSMNRPWLVDSWPARHGGRVCPYLSCLDCGAEVVWPQEALAAGKEKLACSACSWSVGGDVLPLTRDALAARSPDIMFTTTEMLNRVSADRRAGRLFGWDPRAASRPRLLLLDEIHTYEGVHGAHVALLLRRWRHAVGRPVTVVGLSATLRQAPEFMASLTGLSLADVRHVEPHPDDLVHEGRQYQLAMRADALSGASVLSATIQSLMLFGRVMEPPGSRARIFGSKTFAFTDDLDVVNRLYHDLRDAEGSGWMSRRRGAVDKVLANLRSPHGPDAGKRARDGQSWELPDAVGHKLPGVGPARPLEIGRTNSQDPGVADRASVIVATASLDVGFNDPRVGLVLQHRAPRNGAQFLQRRGRAGRRRETRPMTVVVLSDYGRDRIAYQSYDRLFDPEVAARWLPIANRYVTRMQATFALADWLSRSFPDVGDMRKLLQIDTAGDRAATAIAERLAMLLVDAETQQELADFLHRALRLAPEEIQAILWEPPRALLSAVVPTLLRRLRSQWRSAAPDPGAVKGAFAPEFVPRALFDALALPEVELVLPAGQEKVNSRMPVAQALREAAPGRVSKRFAVGSGAERTWIAPENADGLPTLALSSFVSSGDPLGQWSFGDESYVVVRPHQLTVTAPPADVRDTSHAAPIWRSAFLPTAPGAPLELPVGGSWQQLVESVELYAHASRNSVEVRRASPGSIADLRTTASREVHVAYIDKSGDPAALGFVLDVDALMLRVRLPDLAALRDCPHLRQGGWQSVWFEHLVTTDVALRALGNEFQLRWLAQAVRALLVDRAVEQGDSVSAALDGLDAGAFSTLLTAAVSDLQATEPEGEDELDSTPHVAADGHSSRLLDLAAKPETVEALLRCATELQAGAPSEAECDFARRVVVDTLAAAVYHAIISLLPDVDERDLVIDSEIVGEEAMVWISETTIGGAGAIERLNETYQRDPRRFWRLALHALGPGDHEVVDAQLTDLLAAVAADPTGALAQAIAAVRAAEDNARTAETFQALLTRMAEDGARVNHAFTAALGARPLRPGWTAHTDAAVAGWLARRAVLEEQLGLEIDDRVWSQTVAADEARAGRKLSTDQVYALLWPRGIRAFNHHLQTYNPFGVPVTVDKDLLLALLPNPCAVVEAVGPDWVARAQGQLQQQGCVQILAPAAERGALKRGLLELIGSPIDIGYLLVHPVVRAVTGGAGMTSVVLELAEALQ